MKHMAKGLVDYHCWATRKMLKHLRALPRDVFTMRLNSIFSSIEAVVVHMLAVDELWLARMKEKEHSSAEEKTGWPVQQFILAYEQLLEELREFVEETEDVTRSISYQNSKGETFTNTVLEIIQHIVNHGTYHRGNIAAMLHQQGCRFVPTDYIFFLREQ